MNRTESQKQAIELWKDVPNLEGKYMASSFGRIKSKSRTVNRSTCILTVNEKILTPSVHSAGYLVVTCEPGKKQFVHRIIAETFIPNDKNKKTVNHKNGNRKDNRVENLEWNTHKENNIHAYHVLKRRSRKGIKNGFGKTEVMKYQFKK